MPHATVAGGAWRTVVGLGLALTPCVVAVAAALAPRVHPAPELANALAFAGATLVPILALAILAARAAPLAAMLGTATVAGGTLLVLVLRHPAPLTAVLLVDAALVGLAWGLGTNIGRRVQHAAHLLPACVVAASADLVSLLSPEGPSHAIVESDRALSVLATWFPVPGSHAVAPALGLGDLLFIALVFGVATVHGLPYTRAILLVLLGTACAGLAAAWLAVAVPALLPIAGVLLLGLPGVRRVRPADRSATKWSIVIAISIVIAVVARNFLSR